MARWLAISSGPWGRLAASGAVTPVAASRSAVSGCGDSFFTCSSLACGSCTVHHSSLWHWEPVTKRDLERRGGDGVMAFTLAPRCDRGPGVRGGKVIRARQGSKHQHLLRPGAPVGEVLE